MNKDEKATAVAELTETFGRARLAIVTESAGLPVNQVRNFASYCEVLKPNTRWSRIRWPPVLLRARSFPG